MFVLTRHPDDAPHAPEVTFLNCDVAEAVRGGLEAAEGNLEATTSAGAPIWLGLLNGDCQAAAVNARCRPLGA